MKKILFTIAMFLLVSIYCNGQDTLKQKFSSRYETKGGRGMMMPHWAVDSTWSPGDKPKSDYEKYWEAREDSIDKSRSHVDKGQANRPFGGIHFVPGTKENNVAVNEVENDVNYVEADNYYDSDPFYYSHNIGMFYHGGFNYWMYDNPYYYSGFYWGFGYNPYWYSPFYFGYSYWYNPYYYGGYPYYYGGYPAYSYYPNYNNHSAGRASYGALGSNHFTSYGNSYSTSSRYQDVSRRKSSGPMTQQSRPEYSKSNRSYTPSYENPRMSTRPAYNNSRVNNNVSQSRNMNNTYNRSTQTRTSPQQGTRSFSQQNQSRNQTRSYSAPTNRSYSPPATNYNNSGGMDRRSSGSFNSSQSSGGNFNGGGVSRSSSGGGSSSSGSMGSSHSSGRR